MLIIKHTLTVIKKIEDVQSALLNIKSWKNNRFIYH